MTERISIAEQRASGGLAGLRSSATGRSLRDIAESAVASAEKARSAKKAANATPTKGESGKTDAKRFVIGIDPGVKTGFAVWDRERRELTTVETVNFWTLFLGIQRSLLYNTSNTTFVIEVANYAPTFRERRGKAGSAGIADRMARNVGGLSREADLLVQGFKELGYEVIERKPIGKAKKGGKYDAAEDKHQFEQQTGWTKQTSQHARDGARLCFQA